MWEAKELAKQIKMYLPHCRDGGVAILLEGLRTTEYDFWMRYGCTPEKFIYGNELIGDNNE